MGPMASEDLVAQEEIICACRQLICGFLVSSHCLADSDFQAVTAAGEVLSMWVCNLLPAYDMCELTLVGQAFLWHQVRCIMGILLLVGQGKEKVDVMKQLLDVESHPR